MTGRKTAARRKKTRSASGGRAKVSASSTQVEDAEARWRREERYRSVVNVMSEGMVLQTAEGTIVDCNEQATRILGQTRNQILGRTSRDPHWRAVSEDGSPFPGEEHPAMITLKTGQPCRQVVMGLHLPKGVLRWININAEPLFWNRKNKPDAVVVTFSDITERKRIEASLQESNALLSLFMQHSPIFAYIKEVTPDASRVLFASDNFREMVGIPGSAMQGKTMAELFPTGFAAKITRDDQTVLAKGEVLKADEELNGRYYTTVKFPIIQGGRSLLAGYTIDITEHKQAEAKLQRSEERFRAIADFSPDIISIFDQEGRLVYNSAAAERIHGYKPAELENRSTFDFIHPEDRPSVTAAFSRLLKDEAEEVKVQYRYRNANGSYKWMEAIGRNELANPQITGIIAISRDITERKQVEESLRKSQQFIIETGKIGKVGGWEFDVHTGKQTWTEAVYDIHEVDLSYEPTVEKGVRFYTPASRPVVERAVKTAIERGKSFDVELEIVTAKGNLRWVKAIGKPDPERRRIFGFFQDITERKQAELELRQLNETLEQRVAERTAALQASEERFRAIATNTPDHILIQNRELRYQLVINPQLGLTAADMIGRTDRDLFHPADAARLAVLKKRVLKTGKPVRLEIPFPNLKGEVEYFDGVYMPKRNPKGKVDGLIGYFRNVTQHKRAEEKLKESEEKFSVAFKNSPTPMNISRVDNGLIVDANDAFIATTGYPLKEVINSNIKALGIWVNSKNRAQVVKQMIDQGKVTDTEFQYRRKNGEVGTGIYSAHLIHLKKAPHILSAVKDITERKNAAVALRQSEEQLRFALESIHAGAWSLNLTDHTALRSLEHDRIFGYAKLLPEWTYEIFLEHVLPEDRAAVDAKFQAALASQSNWNIECRIRRPDGKIRWILGTGRHHQDVADAPQRMAGIVQDITERKRAAAALEQSEARFRQIVANIEDVLYWVDSQSREFSYISPVFEQMLGYTLDDVILLGGREKFLAQVIQGGNFENQRALFCKMQATPIDTTPTPRWQAWWRCKDGSLKFIEDFWLPVYFEGKLQYTYGMLRDITERVRLEQEVLNISDWERRRIAQDLHDGLGQLLVGAGFLANALRKDLAEKTEYLAPRLNRIQAAINAAGKQARDVARGVQPVEPELNGLMTALAKLAEQTSELFRVRCDFICPRPVAIEDNQVATHLFRIAQESVTNAIKHGRAKRISLHLTRTPKQIILAIKDDGVGLASRRQKKAGMGLRIMHYRAGIIGGMLTIQNKSVGGTTVACRAPISDGKHQPVTVKKD